MNISISRQNQGGALIAVCLLALIVAATLASYLLLCSGEFQFVQRSEAWNNAMAVAEAGMEEGLQEANINIGAFEKIAQWTNNIDAGANGWEILSGTNATSVKAKTWIFNGNSQTWKSTSGNIYHIKRWLDSSNGYYDLYLNNSLGGTNSGPEILSIGTALWNGSHPGGNSDTNIAISINGTTVSRTVYMQTKLDALVNGNLVSLTNTVFNGNGVTIDSFDSADPKHSNWQTNWVYHGTNQYGIYPTNNPMDPSFDSDNTEPFKRKDNGQVATDGNLITVQNANVAGYVNTAPGGTATIGANGVVGNVYWTFVSPMSGLQPGHSRDDMNTIYPDVKLPDAYTNSATYSNIVGSGNSTITFKNYGGLGTNYYMLTDSSHSGTGSTGNPIYVKGTNIIIYIPNGIDYTGSSTKQMTVETNSDATFYVGTQLSTGGNAGFNNAGQYAPAFAILGLPSCTSITLGGNGAVTAYVYAPEAALSMGGGGSTTYDSVGAFFVRSINFGGHINFHYDEQLLRIGPSRGYIPVRWEEVTLQ